jgi:hypothetical protein
MTAVGARVFPAGARFGVPEPGMGGENRLGAAMVSPLVPASGCPNRAGAGKTDDGGRSV